MGQSPSSKASVTLSWLLRHGAAEQGLDVDPAGWISEAQVLKALRWSVAQLDEVVADNNKQRYARRDGKIRASQGHSRELPVTLDALEASWARYEGEDSLWHTTRLEHLAAIMDQGLRAMDRTHVHLASGVDSHVGKRGGGVAALIEVSALLLREAGQEVFESPNGVVLVREVPARCLVSLQPLTRAAQQQAPQWAGRWPHVTVTL
jgi:putative RNA 2'-phosphotransferase